MEDNIANSITIEGRIKHLEETCKCVIMVQSLAEEEEEETVYYPEWELYYDNTVASKCTLITLH